MKPLRLAALLLLGSLLSSAATAADRRDALAAVLGLQRLDIDVTMMLYDEGNQAAIDTTRRQLEGLQHPVAALLTDIGKADPAQGTTAQEAWSLVRLAIAGDRQTPGMLASGYDAKAFAELRTALADLLQAINRQYKVQPGNTPEEQALLLAGNIVTVYIRTAGAPFGSYSDNNDAGATESLEQMAVRMDKAIADLRLRHGKDAAKAALVQRVNTKWLFIRSTVVKYTQQSTPTIVQRHGVDIIETLATLARP